MDAEEKSRAEKDQEKRISYDKTKTKTMRKLDNLFSRWFQKTGVSLAVPSHHHHRQAESTQNDTKEREDDELRKKKNRVSVDFVRRVLT